MLFTLRDTLSSSWEEELKEEVLRRGKVVLFVAGIFVGVCSLLLTYLDYTFFRSTEWEKTVLFLDLSYVVLCFLVAVESFFRPPLCWKRYHLLAIALFAPVGLVNGFLSAIYPPPYGFQPLLSILVFSILFPVVLPSPFPIFQISYLSPHFLFLLGNALYSSNPEFTRVAFMTLIAFLFAGYIIYVVVVTTLHRDYRQRKELRELSRKLAEQNENLESIVEERRKDLIAEVERRKALEGILRRSLLRYETIVSHSFQVVLEIDPEGKILSADFGGGLFLGWRKEYVVGKNFREFLLDPASVPFPGGAQWRGRRIQVFTSEKIPHWVLVSMGRFQPEGEKERYIAVIKDVQEEVEQEEKARIHSQLATIGLFIKGIAHDFKNSLQFFLTSLELLKERKDPLLLDRLLKKFRDFHFLVEKILAFGKEETEEKDRESLELGKFLQENSLFFRAILPERVSLSWEIPSEEVWIKADESEFRMVLTHLFSNAVDAMEEKGSIFVRVYRSSEEGYPWKMEVEDTGSGIPPEALKKVFDLFYSVKKKGVGTGLGLPLVRRWVEGWGGKVWITSTPGQGTTVHLLLKGGVLQEKEKGREFLPPDLSFSLQGKDLLLVEDEEEVRWVLEQLCKAVGVCCVPVKDLKSAREALLRKTFHWVLCDYLLQDGLGVDLAEEVRSYPRPPAFLLMTGYGEEEISRERSSLSVSAILEKPFSPRTLEETLLQTFPEWGRGEVAGGVNPKLSR